MYTVFHLGLAHHAWTNEIHGLTVGGTNVEAPFFPLGTKLCLFKVTSSVGAKQMRQSYPGRENLGIFSMLVHNYKVQQLKKIVLRLSLNSAAASVANVIINYRFVMYR